MSRIYQCKDGVITPLNFFGTDIAYDICEFYYFRNPNLKPGFYPANGGLIENADIVAPIAFEYLQSEGNAMCITLEEWNTMSSNKYYNGIGGVPYYSINIDKKTIKLPDLRGMYPQGATENIGTVKEPGLPNIIGSWSPVNSWMISATYGAFYVIGNSKTYKQATTSHTTALYPAFGLNASLYNSIYGNSTTVQPPSYTLYATIYLGVTL